MKERITITIDKELLFWVDSRIQSKIFANRSHAFEFLIFELQTASSSQTESSFDNKKTTGSDDEKNHRKSNT